MKLLKFFFIFILTIIVSQRFIYGSLISNPEKGTVTLSGTVVDEMNRPLPFVGVSIPALHRGVLTDDNGKFLLEDLYSGIYTIEFTLLGYKKETRSVTVTSGNEEVKIILLQTSLILPGIIITGKPQPTDVLSSPQSISTIDGRELNRQRGQNIIQALEYSPGVSTFSTGNGIAKPVIRGLTSQRVLVISDGVRQEGQQWGDEHGIEIDAFDVERIEVLRGPASVLYGSDALGGVINIIKHELPSVKEGYSSLGGQFQFSGFSNSQHASGDLSLFGASGIFGYRGHFSLREAGDIQTPGGKLSNSGIKERSGGGLIGIKQNWGAVSIDYSDFTQNLQIHEDPSEEPGATPFQKIRHSKIHFHGDLPFEFLRLELDASWQKNIRKEFEEKGAALPVLQMNLNTYAFDLKGHHQPLGNIFGTMGISFMSQKNESPSEEKIIPAFNQNNLAAFVYEETQINRLNISAGARYDFRKLRIEQTENLDIQRQTKNYNSLTGTVGLVYRISDPAAIAINVGRGWRSPTPFELYVNGVHEGTVRYEIGDANLGNETSLNTDLSFRYITNRTEFELTLFRNDIDNYIYLSPTGMNDTSSGYAVYSNKQADAQLLGTEVSVKIQTAKWLILNSNYNYIYAKNRMTGNPLPLIPANSFRIGAMITIPYFGLLANPYLLFDARIVASQKRIELFETSTGGYTLFNAGVGTELLLGSGRLSIDLSVQNIFNKAYREHLNRYKEYALNPGRNIKLDISIPFILMH